MPEESTPQSFAEVSPVMEEALAAASAGAKPPKQLIKIELPPAAIPTRLRRFERKPLVANRRMAWRRGMLCGLGLILLVGCLFGLLHSGPFIEWAWLRATQPNDYGDICVVVDPGHGGGDYGAVAQGVVEKDLNLDVGLRVAHALRTHGVKVKMTRENDHFVPLEGRVRMANVLPHAVFVSIHFNDDPESGRAPSRASGIETYYSETRQFSNSSNRWMWTAMFKGTQEANVSSDPAQLRETVRQSQMLADNIQGALITSTSAPNRGIKERSLYVTRRVQAPSVLVEGGFVSHPAEARRLGDPAYRQQLADSIVSGILKYLDATSRQPPPPSPTLALAKH